MSRFHRTTDETNLVLSNIELVVARLSEEVAELQQVVSGIHSIDSSHILQILPYLRPDNPNG